MSRRSKDFANVLATQSINIDIPRIEFEPHELDSEITYTNLADLHNAFHDQDESESMLRIMEKYTGKRLPETPSSVPGQVSP